MTLRLAARAGLTAIARLSEAGALKIRFPRPATGICQAMLINTAGGITGGDRLRTAIELGEGAAAAITTQGAERLYRASLGSCASSIETVLDAEAAADLVWLPQETIVFDGSRTERRLCVRLAAGARFCGLERLVFGRHAAGEILRDAHLSDHLSIQIGEDLVFSDALRLHGDLERLLGRAAIGDGARAVATLLVVSPHVQPLQERLRGLLGGRTLGRDGIEGGVSLLNGLMLARILSHDGAGLRRACIDMLAAMDVEVPRAWQI